MIWMAFTAISKKFPLHLSEYWPNIVHSYRLRNIFYFCIFFRFKTLLAPFTYLLSNFSLKTDVISINHSQVKLKHSLFSVILPFTYGGIYGLYQANFFQDRGLVQIKSLWNAAPWNSFSHFSHVKHSMKPTQDPHKSPDNKPFVEKYKVQEGFNRFSIFCLLFDLIWCKN